MEKAGAAAASANSLTQGESVLDVVSKAEEKRILRRIDVRVALLLGLMYCFSLIDRSNLSAAAISGMIEDLDLTGNRYNIISLAFFPTYILFQPIAVIVLRKIGPRTFLSAIVMLWGGITISSAFTKTWEQMMVIRLLLGLLECGYFPSCAYILSCWYTRYELHQRNALFFVVGSVASGFGGILAYGLQNLAGRAGLNGWSWIFIIEGIITCLLAILGAVFIVDFPEKLQKTRGFLSESETDFVISRLDADRHDVAAEPFKIGLFLRGALDLKVWAFAASFCLGTTTTYAIAFFLPVILRNGMGFSVAASQCLIAPPYVLAAIFMYAEAVLSDKYRVRAPFVVVNAVLSLVGLAILGLTSKAAVRYFGVFLAVIGSTANVPTILTYQANNVRGQWKRAFSSASLVAAGGIGGIIGSLVFRSQDAPTYRPGTIATMACNGLMIVIVMLLSWKFTRANRRAEQGGKPIEGLEGFRYTI